jgi:hypothetical protein
MSNEQAHPIATNRHESHLQVAQRVFVNDVIVRFHKTLELEEDEIKTLICRYPPPLDITGGAAAGSGLVHELEGQAIGSNR